MAWGESVHREETSTWDRPLRNSSRLRGRENRRRSQEKGEGPWRAGSGSYREAEFYAV